MNLNILICLNHLDIGGVETAVINQSIEFLTRGYNVYILAKDGIYTETMKKRGAICINFEYNLKDGYDLEKANEIINIIKKYNIEQVHIHQIDCISSVFPACLKLNVPYIAYSHTGVRGAYEWFENNYVGYKIIINNYFKMAEKIITITKSAKEEIQKKYKISDNKFLLLNNSINFDFISINNLRIPKKIKKFLIVSRFADEKLESIKNAIQIFKLYKKGNPHSSLTIVGTGPLENQVLSEIEDIKQSVLMLGASNEVMKIMMEHDVVIGVDRCILEAIATKRIAIISGYDSILEILKPENIKNAATENFSGRTLNNRNMHQIVDELNQFSKKTIKEITSYNFNFAYENLNIKKNIFCLSEIPAKQLIDKSIYCEQINMLVNEVIQNKKEKERIYKECKNAQNYFENQIINKDKCIEELKKQIANIKSKNV